MNEEIKIDKLILEVSGSPKKPKLSAAMASIIVALITVAGTMTVGYMAGFFNSQVQQEKFEADLIVKLADVSEVRTRENLYFFLDAGLLTDPSGKLREQLNRPGGLAMSPTAAAPAQAAPPTVNPTTAPAPVATTSNRPLAILEWKSGKNKKRFDSLIPKLRAGGFRIDLGVRGLAGDAPEITFHPNDKTRAEEIKAIMAPLGYPDISLKPDDKQKETQIFVYTSD